MNRRKKTGKSEKNQLGSRNLKKKKNVKWCREKIIPKYLLLVKKKWKSSK